MSSFITPSLKNIKNIYEKNGFEIRIVGGAVRDILSNKKPKDIDLATDAKPDTSKELLETYGFRVIETGLHHGTISVVTNDDVYEITTLRVDVETFGRHAQIEYTTNWKEDARRRDLTFNAMSIDLNGNIYDYFGGLNDLKKSKATFVGDADKRLQEDYLRILRYFRFQSKLKSLNFDDDTLNSIERNVNGLKQLSGERIWQEMSKLFEGYNVTEILKVMLNVGVIDTIGLDKNLDFDKLKRMEKITTDYLVRLASAINKTMLDNIRNLWKISNDEYNIISSLYIHHDNYIRCDNRERYIKEMFVKKSISEEFIKRFTCYIELPNLFRKHYNMKNVKFPLDGNDLKEIGFPKGKIIGDILQKVWDIWVKSDFELNRDELLNYAKSILDDYNK